MMKMLSMYLQFDGKEINNANFHRKMKGACEAVKTPSIEQLNSD